MQSESKQVPDDHGTERTIVLQVLTAERCSRVKLLSELRDVSAEAISDALSNLEAQGVVVIVDEQVRASGTTRHLDALGLIAV
jgi:hypothetical protein